MIAMSNLIEAQGVTVDEAIQLALNQLGVGRDSVEIKILHHPRKGFLGIGARRAKVQATVRQDALEDGAPRGTWACAAGKPAAGKGPA